MRHAMASCALVVCACSGGGITLLNDAAAPGDGAQANDGASPTDAAQSGDGDGAVPRYNIDLTSTSVSGLSSGGFMAVQFHVAFSSIMKGAAVFAGGPYMCRKARSRRPSRAALGDRPQSMSRRWWR